MRPAPDEANAITVSGHPWDELRLAPTGWTVGGQGFHESLLRSYRLVVALRDMIHRGDSRETLLAFIAWIGAEASGSQYQCQDADIRLARQYEQITELEAAIRKGDALEQAVLKHELDRVCEWLAGLTKCPCELTGEHISSALISTLIRSLRAGAHRTPAVAFPESGAPA